MRESSNKREKYTFICANLQVIYSIDQSFELGFALRNSIQCLYMCCDFHIFCIVLYSMVQVENNYENDFLAFIDLSIIFEFYL